MKTPREYFQKRRAVLATMHGKEKVIAPLLSEAFALDVFVPSVMDTDHFGTFTRDIKRPADQLATARLKALKAMDITGADIGIASEGSFGVHPSMPFAPSNTEIVILIDRIHDLEILGGYLSLHTHMHHASVTSVPEALAFAADHDFPRHGLIVRKNERSTRGMQKEITSLDALEQAVAKMLQESLRKNVFLETDMRAHRNPTRLLNIAKATEDLIQKMKCFCPVCETPGYDCHEIRKGLQCSHCGLPTDNVYSHVYKCAKCSHSEERVFPYGKEHADPGECQFCNP